MYKLDSKGVLDRLTKALNVNSDNELAEQLGVAKQTIATWKKRNKVPLDYVVEVAVQHNLSVDSILFDKGTKTENSISTSVRNTFQTLSDIKLAEMVLDSLDEELNLTDQGLNNDTLYLILSTIREVKILINDDIFDYEKHKNEFDRAITQRLAWDCEMKYIAQRNAERKEND